MKKTNTIAALILASVMLEGCSATTIPALLSLKAQIQLQVRIQASVQVQAQV